MVIDFVLMDPRLPVWTNAAILSLILSSTNWLILSISSLDVYLCESLIMFQFFLNLIHNSMWSMWQVDSVVFGVLAHLETSFCLASICIEYTHMEFGILYKWHVLVWGKNSCDDSCIVRVHHVLCYVRHKITMEETCL